MATPTIDGRTIPERATELEESTETLHLLAETQKRWNAIVDEILQELIAETEALRAQVDAQSKLIGMLAGTLDRLEA